MQKREYETIGTASGTDCFVFPGYCGFLYF
jgi:hypothetical protein